MKRNWLICSVLPLAIFGLFGYTSKAPAVGGIKSLYVKTVVNKIDVAAEISEKNPYKSYSPGVEVEITKVLVDRFLHDGSLKMLPPDGADAELSGELVSYDKQPLRYSTDEEVDEFRINVVVDFKLTDLRDANKKVLWEARLAGDSAQVTAGKFSKTETQALNDALIDLTRRVVEKTFQEDWQ